ncbi:MAG: endonuclease III domain-containing protein [Candidatus Auribacterota bacterium]|jgi:endonuclease-3 related protein|uniref:Endonuclease III domain-containing protein n=1 Tax=Candidatus Auribacter fodinae TaxID=2093366 RepID=A0A3A4R198_9BACT|nr:MAG: endonuclease III domain-containing protein [Candidatus Auribacter fodinae]
MSSADTLKNQLILIFQKMFGHFGPLNWWPGDSPLEVMLGAILTQNTAWSNVEKALASLSQKTGLDPEKIRQLSDVELAACIRSSGYFNQKAKKLRVFLTYFHDRYGDSIEAMKEQPLERLRDELLSLHGIGPETADSILLYALDKLIFVVDAYTRRILARHGLMHHTADYHAMQDLFQQNIPPDISLYNEYHALIVNTGKDFCRTKPLCDSCPLRTLLPPGGPCMP